MSAMITRVAIAVVALAAGLAATAQASPGFRWFEPAAAPSGWKRISLPSGGATLSYPRSLVPVKGDKVSVAVAQHDRRGRVLVYLNLTPKEGNETVRNWPDFRLRHVREESKDVHEDGRAVGLWFIGGRGSCVMDDYVTRFKANHYREIACFVQGRTTASVIVGAALASRWTRAEPLLRRAVEAYEVG